MKGIPTTREAPRLEPGTIVRHRTTQRFGLLYVALDNDEAYIKFEDEEKDRRVKLSDLLFPESKAQHREWFRRYWVIVDPENAGTSEGAPDLHSTTQPRAQAEVLPRGKTGAPSTRLSFVRGLLGRR